MTQSEPSSGFTQMRATIFARLRDDVPQIAEFYEVGLELVFDATKNARKYLLAHTMREIRPQLPLHYGVEITRSRVEYAKEVRRFYDDWTTTWSVQTSEARQFFLLCPRPFLCRERLPSRSMHCLLSMWLPCTPSGFSSPKVRDLHAEQT